MPDDYTLEGRPLTREDHRDWVPRFDSGEHFWCQDVDHFLRNSAWSFQHRGYCRTTVFSFPKDREIIGFIAACVESVPPESLAGMLPAGVHRWPIPVVHWLYFGVHRPYQGDGFGRELWVQFLENVLASMMRPRFIVLEVFAENPISDWYRKLDFVELERKPYRVRGTAEERELVSMARDLDG